MNSRELASQLRKDLRSIKIKLIRDDNRLIKMFGLVKDTFKIPNKINRSFETIEEYLKDRSLTSKQYLNKISKNRK